MQRKLQAFVGIFKTFVTYYRSSCYYQCWREFVESVGDCIFNDRPANIAYIMAFLEFVHQIFEDSNTLSPDIIIDSVVNVIERTSFNSIQDNSKLFRFIVDIYVNIIVLIIISLL